VALRAIPSPKLVTILDKMVAGFSVWSTQRPCSTEEKTFKKHWL